MQDEVVGRLRNSFAHLLLEVMGEPSAPKVAASFALPFSSVTEADWRRANELWRLHAAELLAPLPTRPCPACGADDSRWLFESHDAHHFHECRQCGCWFTPKVIDWSVFESLFAIAPEARVHAAAMMRHRDDSVREADLTRIGAYLDDLLPLIARSNGNRVAYLDAGCGVGHSLRAGRDRGLIVQGVEVDGAAVAIAKSAGLPVVTPDELATVPPGPYQLLSFWETLEHIARPLEALERLLPFLADDGIVAITVPNLNAPAIRVMREACEWVHGGYNTPGHVNLFHVPALDRLLSRAGLTLIDAEGQFGGDPLEVLAYLGGETRGVFDVLDSTPPGTLPSFLGPLMNNVGPGLALLEQYALASPILRVIACRRGREAGFAGAVAERKTSRARRLEAEARRLIAFEVDYKREIELRDRLLTELRTTWESSLSYKFSRIVAKLTG